MFSFLSLQRVLRAGETPTQISEILMFLEWNKKIKYCATFLFILFAFAIAYIGYSLLSIHWPTFSVSLRKTNTVFILKDCHKK